MSRQDTIAGYYNFPAPIAQTTETATLAPSASGVYAGFPSPIFPLSTTTYPTLVYVAPTPDIALGEFDGHGFEVKITGKITTTATANLTINLYQVTNAAVAVGPSGSGYPATLTAGPSGTGVTKLTTGTATAVGTGGASINFSVSQQYIWDSVSKTLYCANAQNQFIKGATVSVTQSAASVASLSTIADLNFFPTFTVSALGTGVTLTLSEFVINRV